MSYSDAMFYFLHFFLLWSVCCHFSSFSYGGCFFICVSFIFWADRRSWWFSPGKLVDEKFSLFSTSLHSIWFVHFHFSSLSLAVAWRCGLFHSNPPLSPTFCCVLILNGARHLTSLFSVGIVWFYGKSELFPLFSLFFLLIFLVFFLFLLSFRYECEIDFVVINNFFSCRFCCYCRCRRSFFLSLVFSSVAYLDYQAPWHFSWYEFLIPFIWTATRNR